MPGMAKGQKRGNGEGSKLHKRKDGRWECRYVLHTAAGPKRKAVYGKTRAEAAGKMVPDQEFSEGDWRGQSDLFQGDNFRKNLEKVEELKKFAEERDHTVAQLAVAWTLANPAVDVAIVGARRPDHIEGTAPAAEFDLSADDLREIEDIMQGAVMVGGPSPEGV